MFLSPQEALSILEHYKYLVIFPVTVLEGPIITVIGGFLVYLGFLNGYVAYFLLALGDWIGDILHYVLGRYFSRLAWFNKTIKYFGYNLEQEKVIERHFAKHPRKTVLLAKLSHGAGGFVQIVAGMAKMDFWQFALYSLLGTLPKSLLLFVVGYYIGNSYQKIDKYMDRVAYFVVFVLIVFVSYMLVKRAVKKQVVEK